MKGKNASLSPPKIHTPTAPSPSSPPYPSSPPSPSSAPFPSSHPTSSPPSSLPAGKGSVGCVGEEEQIYADIRESERKIMGLEDERRAKHYLEMKSRSVAPAT